MQVKLYTSPACQPCDDVSRILVRLAPQYDLEITEVDVSADTSLTAEYGLIIPVVEIEGSLGRLQAPIDEAQLRVHLEVARRAHPSKSSVSVVQQRPQGARSPDDFVGYIARHWLRFVTIALGIFVGLPWLAPVFAALGWWGLADPIYTAYALT